jgi:N-methylhydantoinase B
MSIVQERRPQIAPVDRLRELSAHDFADRYGCDRFVASVLSSRFAYIIQHMSAKLQTNSFSPILRDSTDFAITISGPPELGWAMPAVSQTVPLFYGPVPDGVRVIMEEIGVENLCPGDVYIANDSYRVGTHVNDVTFVKPMFHGDKFVGVLDITAHQLDFGGKIMGGFDYSKTTLYEDGLVLPPIPLYQGGEPVKSTFSLIEANTRLADLVLPDIQTINRCLEMGERFISESIDKYGLPVYFGAIRYACDASAEAMASAIEDVPDGVYEAEEILDGDSLPDSPEYVVKVKINKRGSRAEFDFGGSSRATTGALNCTWADAKTGVAMALKMLLDQHSLFTSGTLRNVDVLVPEGSLLNPAPPACTQGFTQPVDAAITCIFKALNPVLGERATCPDSWAWTTHTATGKYPDGKVWYANALSGTGPGVPWGASASGDGDALQSQDYVNVILAGLEPAEAEIPAVIMRHEVLPDTGGPGYNRGGASVVAESYWPARGDHNVFLMHIKRPTGGVNGGRPGSLGGGWLFLPTAGHEGPLTAPPLGKERVSRAVLPLAGMLDPETFSLDVEGEYFTAGPTWTVEEDSILRLVANGAGGWGDPFEREPERVLADVRNEYVSVEGAARDYGVVVHGDPLRDPEGVQLDLEATLALRGDLRCAASE